MVIASFLKDGKPEKKILYVQNRDNAKDEATLPLPTYNPEILKVVYNHMGAKDWKSEADGSEGITDLLMLCPDDKLWTQTRKMLIDFSLVGEKTLQELLPEVLEDSATYSIEEYTMAYWTSAVIKVLFTLQEKNVPADKIDKEQALRDLFN